LIRSTEPTEVPPYFCTISAIAAGTRLETEAYYSSTLVKPNPCSGSPNHRKRKRNSRPKHQSAQTKPDRKIKTPRSEMDLTRMRLKTSHANLWNGRRAGIAVKGGGS
jgi:hypothetical protein